MPRSRSLTALMALSCSLAGCGGAGPSASSPGKIFPVHSGFRKQNPQPSQIVSLRHARCSSSRAAHATAAVCFRKWSISVGDTDRRQPRRSCEV